MKTIQIENPYKPFIPAESNFCGREPFLDLFKNRLSMEIPRKHILITGIGGIGKTSLLYKFRSQSDSKMYKDQFKINRTCLINIEPTGNDLIRVCDLLKNTLSKCKHLGVKGKLNPLQTRLSIGFPPSISFSLAKPEIDSVPKDFEELQHELLKELNIIINQGVVCIFFIDPIEKILEWTNGQRRFCQLLSLILKTTVNSGVLFILCSRPDGKGDIEHYLNPGLFDPKYIEHWPLEPLSLKESEDAIIRPAARNKVVFNKVIVQTISEKCGGHPYSLQLACYHIWNYLESDNLLSGSSINLKIDIIEQVLKNSQQWLFREGFNEAEKAILKVLAIGRIPLSESDIIARVKLYFNIQEIITSETLKILLKKHSHRPLKHEEGKYCIAHDLFGNYIREQECKKQEQELEIARAELATRQLAWKLGHRGFLYPSSLKLIRKYFTSINLDDDALDIILRSEADAGNSDYIKLYVSKYGIEKCQKVLFSLLNEVTEERVLIEILDIFLSASEFLRSKAIYLTCKHSNDKVRAKAIEGFKSISKHFLDDKRILDAIWLSLKHPNPKVRMVGIQISVELKLLNWKVWQDGLMAYKLTDRIRSLLDDDDINVATIASEYFPLLGDKAIKLLLPIIFPNRTLFITSEKTQRWGLALEILSKIEDRKLHQELYTRVVKALRNSDSSIQILAIQFLKDCKGFPVIDIFEKFLINDYPSPRVRLEVIEALGNIGGEVAANVLASQLTSSNLKIRLGTITALGQLGKYSVPILEKFFCHKAPTKLNTEMREVLKACLNALVAIGPESKCILLNAMNSYHALVRSLAIKGIAKLNIQEGKKQIRELLNDPDIVVKRKAVEALGRLNDVSAGPLLAPMLCDKDTIIRDKVTKSLQLLGNEVISSLIKRFESDEPIAKEICKRLKEI